MTSARNTTYYTGAHIPLQVISLEFPHSKGSHSVYIRPTGTSKPSTAVLEKPLASTSSPGRRDEDFHRVHQGSRSSPARSASSQHSPSPTRLARYSLHVSTEEALKISSTKSPHRFYGRCPPRSRQVRHVLHRSAGHPSPTRPAATYAGI